MTITKPVEILGAGGRILLGEFRLWDQAPENPDLVRIDLHFAAEVLTALGDSYFEALVEIRLLLESRGLRPRSFGASKTVYPSPLALSMGNGERGYQLELRRPARLKDLVSIFDSDPAVHPVSIEEQRAFYQQWLESFG
jgi:hypothetical protein